MSLLELAGRPLLYANEQQKLFELNETALGIWRVLDGGGSLEAAAQDLVRLGAAPEEALRMAADAARTWVLSGVLAPAAVQDVVDRGRPADRTLALDELAVEIRLCGVGPEPLDAVFGHLYGVGQGARRRLTIAPFEDRLLFYLDDALHLVGEADGLVAHVKALLTELYADSVEEAFLTHGALLVRGERAVLLTGEPGAGKTTLALALAAAGWAYGGDDIVRIMPEAAVRAAPFAATVKAGSLPLLREWWPELERSAESQRPDGRSARYLLPPRRAEPASRPLEAVFTLARSEGPAKVKPISPLDALSAIIGGAYARRWRMTPEALRALATSLEAACCAELAYSDLEDAVRALEDVVAIPAQAA